jgi:hypothetical protein
VSGYDEVYQAYGFFDELGPPGGVNVYEATHGQDGGPLPGRFDLSDVRPAPLLPTDPKARKEEPIARGVLDYFPLALAAVANVSYVANEQHNPGEPMHWARGKSADHADCILRHLIERGTLDTDGLRHTAKVAWRALALLQEELEAVNDKGTQH